MGMEISNRLQTLIDLVPIVKTVVDIGCDHGYVPIALIRSGKVEHAIASDINVGPLERAKKNILESGYQNQIETRLSNGFDQIQIGEVDLAILAGMGGRLMQSILTKEMEKTKKIDTLILQPQSELLEVRELLPKIGYICINEKAICEDDKFYFIMLVTKNEKTKEKFSELELRFGKYLLQRKDPVLFQFILQKQKEYVKIIKALSIDNRSTKNQKKRMKEIHIEMQYIECALEYYKKEINNERES
jgi:tRNA (adenine22-N1)-methyltransferase